MSLIGQPTHNAAEIIERIRGRRVLASVSGGRDSAAMSLYLRELGIEHDRVFLDTGWEHPATYEYINGELSRALGPIQTIRGPDTFETLVRRKGLFPSRVMRFCTEVLKVVPMQEHVEALLEDGVEVLNTVGIRRAESKARSEMAEWEWPKGFECEVWRPLVRWSHSDVEAILARHRLASNPLYRMGASRVGCWPCIHARKAEVAIVAKTDPDRIAFILRMEEELSAEAQARAAEKGDLLQWWQRTMFSYHGGDDRHIPITIEQAVEWSRSARGEWQPEGSGEGCMRHGFCEVEDSAPRVRLPLFEATT